MEKLDITLLLKLLGVLAFAVASVAAYRRLKIPPPVRNALSFALIVTGVMSLAPVMWTYPLRYVAGEQFFVWTAILLYFIMLLLSGAWSAATRHVPAAFKVPRRHAGDVDDVALRHAAHEAGDPRADSVFAGLEHEKSSLRSREAGGGGGGPMPLPLRKYRDPLGKSLTIVVACFNEEANLRSTYENIAAAIRDGALDDYEIVIVNDGSSDGTGPIAERDRIARRQGARDPQ